MDMGVVGVDEAGKGPVLGAMAVAAIRVPDVSDLPDGLADSKQLQPSIRQDLANQLREISTASIATILVHPGRIDDSSTDMNTLTVATHGEAAGKIIEPDDELFADAADVNPDRFARRLHEALPHSVSLTAEHNADEHYQITAAASILAKVTRDAHIESLETTYGTIGSGYPSDPKTKQFLVEYVREHDRLPPIARSSWSTSQDLLAEHQQKHLSTYE